MSGAVEILTDEVRMEPTGLNLPEQLSYDEWEAIGTRLQQAERSLMWWIGDWLNYGERKYGETYAQAVEATGKAYDTLQNAKWVAARFEMSRRRDNLSWSHHSEVAGLPPKQADEILDWAEDEGASRREVRQRVKEAKHIPLIEQAPELPAGKYRCIVIDPPWPMEKIEREVRPNQVEFDYPVMKLDEITEFPVGNMAHDDCHLFCWTTQRFLIDTFGIMEAWGFRYICGFVWHKPGGFQPVGLPQYNVEYCLYGRKGTPRFLDTKDFFCCFDAPRREHSRKPDEFYDVVRRVTDGPRIDVFSREKRDGFDQFGNEAGKFTNE